MMKPPMMTVPPVSTNPRVLILAKVERAAWIEIVYLRQAKTHGVSGPPLHRGIRSRRKRHLDP
jgi:hypothetical protein